MAFCCDHSIVVQRIPTMHMSFPWTLQGLASRRQGASAMAPAPLCMARRYHQRCARLPEAPVHPRLQPQSGARRATTGDPVQSAPVSLEPAAERGRQPLNWYQQWYPLAIASDCDPRRPLAVSLLGQELVLWRDGSGGWHAHADACPHRLAPLSEGRIEGGHLACAYHGWEFDGSGACVRIPQIGDEQASSAARASQRACVASYPCMEAQGLIWVWAESGPSAAAEAAATPPPLLPELEEGGSGDAEQPPWEASTQWFFRDVPQSLETVLENVSDPNHVNFVHHKVQGARQMEKGRGTIASSEPLSRAGFVCQRTQEGRDFVFTFAFQAPYTIKYVLGGRAFAVLAVPLRAGWTRVFTRFLRRKGARAGNLLFAVVGMVEKMRLLEHALLRNSVLDGDNYMLHVQERTLLQVGGSSAWRQAYYMPGKGDTGVASIRTWFDRYGAAFPLLPHTLQDLPPLLPREQALDRYSQHTVYCPECRGVLHFIDAALPVVRALAAAALLTGLLHVSGFLGTGTAGLVPGLSVLAACGVLAWCADQVMTWLRKKLTFEDYIHAFKD